MVWVVGVDMGTEWNGMEWGSKRLMWMGWGDDGRDRMAGGLGDGDEDEGMRYGRPGREVEGGSLIGQDILAMFRVQWRAPAGEHAQCRLHCVEGREVIAGWWSMRSR